jgi:protein involved in polysaccharide export with SLBB domain/capsular polysaccharide biosynthesis protein
MAESGMSDELELPISELRRRADAGPRHSHHQNGRAHGGSDQGGHSRGGPGRFAGTEPAFGSSAWTEPRVGPFNLWRLLELLLRRWTWLGWGMAGAGIMAFLVGLKITSYTAKVELIRNENPNAFTIPDGGESTTPQAYLSRELSAQTLFVLMRSPEVFRRVSEKAVPPITPWELARAVRVIPDRDPDFVTLAVSGKQPKQSLVNWANVYASEVVAYTKELQSEDAGSISDFLSTKLVKLDAELDHVKEELIRFANEAHTLDVDKEVEAYIRQATEIDGQMERARMDLDTYDFRIKNSQKYLVQQMPSNDRIASAEEELVRLRARGFTDLHPSVKAQKRIIEMLKAQASSGSTNTVEPPVQGGGLANAVQLQILDYTQLKEVRQRELQKYELMKKELEDKAKGLSRTAVNYAELKVRQKRLEDMRGALFGKQQEAQLLRENALGYFKVYSYASPNEVSARQRFVTVGFLSIVGALLGLLAASGVVLLVETLDSRIKTAGDLERATGLPVLATLGDLSRMKPEEQINWAFRTITLLQGRLNESSDETLVCGIISSRHGEGRSTWVNLLVSAASQRGMRVLTVATRPSKMTDEEVSEFRPKQRALLPVGPATTLTKNVLAFPTQVTEQFNDPQAQPIVHIPLPGWVWNLERRQQWRTALESWQEIRNLVLLIELPPACQPESVLLAEHLPQVLWLASSGMPDAEETRGQLETLRHARCNVVGAVLNREPSSFARRHLTQWIRRFSMLGLLAIGLTYGRAAESPVLMARAETTESATNASLSMSATSAAQRAPWQQRLTLGPGDSFDVAVFDHPEMTRTNVVVGPDGKISFFQLFDVPVTGLTIDELRGKLDSLLAPYFVGGARTIVIPENFTSKKYCVLGQVVSEGMFVLDRPLTIIEAVARAKGLQTGGANAADLADLSHSFLVRNGKPLPVDLERLFHQADLSQNVALEPGDYLYFAPGTPAEIYVLGEVQTPGIVPLTQDASVLAAISVRGGFTPKAYTRRVLVIRGSLRHPEAFAIDTPAALAGRTPDFKLQAGDIVYVRARPWIRIEELLDEVTQAFIQGAVTEFAAEVPAVFTSPVIPTP